MVLDRISHKIIYEDMPQVEVLLNVCNAIYICRECSGRNALPLEEELVDLLFMLYRSPEALITWTDLAIVRPAGPLPRVGAGNEAGVGDEA